MISSFELFKCLLKQLNYVCQTELDVNSIQLKGITSEGIRDDFEQLTGMTAPPERTLYSQTFARESALSLLRLASTELVAQYMYHMLKLFERVCVPLQSNKFRVIPREDLDNMLNCLSENQDVDVFKVIRMWNGCSIIKGVGTGISRELSQAFKACPDLTVEIACAVASAEETILPIEMVAAMPDVCVDEFVEFDDAYLQFIYDDVYVKHKTPGLAVAVKKLMSYNDRCFDHEFYTVYKSRPSAGTLYESLCINMQYLANSLMTAGTSFSTQSNPDIQRLSPILRREGKFLENLEKICNTLKPDTDYKQFAIRCKRYFSPVSCKELYNMLVPQFYSVFDYKGVIDSKSFKGPADLILSLAAVCDSAGAALGLLNTDMDVVVLKEVAAADDAVLMANVELVMLEMYGKYFVMYSKDDIAVDTLESANIICDVLRTRYCLQDRALWNAFILAGMCTEYEKQDLPQYAVNQLKELVRTDPDQAVLHAQYLIAKYDNLEPIKYIRELLSNPQDIQFRRRRDIPIKKKDVSTSLYLLQEIQSWRDMPPSDVAKRLKLICNTASNAVVEHDGMFVALCNSVAVLRK